MRKEKPPVPKAARQDDEVSGTRLKKNADRTIELKEEDIKEVFDATNEKEKSGTRRISPDWQKRPISERLSKALNVLEDNDKKVYNSYRNNLLVMEQMRNEQKNLEAQKTKTGHANDYEARMAQAEQTLNERLERMEKLKSEAYAAKDRLPQYQRIREELKKGTGLNFKEEEHTFYESLAPLLLRQANRLAGNPELAAQQEVENLKDLAMRVSLPAETYTFEDADATGKYQTIKTSDEEMPRGKYQALKLDLENEKTSKYPTIKEPDEMPTGKYKAVSTDPDRTGKYNALDEMQTGKYQALHTEAPLQKPAIGPPEVEAKRKRPAIGAPEEAKYLARFQALEKANESKLELVKSFKNYYEPRIAKLEKDLLYYREEAIKRYQRQAEQFSTGDKEALSRSSKADESEAEKIRSLTAELNQMRDQLENLKALERHMKLNTTLTDYQKKLYDQLAA